MRNVPLILLETYEAQDERSSFHLNGNRENSPEEHSFSPYN